MDRDDTRCHGIPRAIGFAFTESWEGMSDWVTLLLAQTSVAAE